MSLVAFLYGSQQPTECPICGAAHSACTTYGHESGKGVIVRQLPSRDTAEAQDVTRRALTALPAPPPTAGPGTPTETAPARTFKAKARRSR